MTWVGSWTCLSHHFFMLAHLSSSFSALPPLTSCLAEQAQELDFPQHPRRVRGGFARVSLEQAHDVLNGNQRPIRPVPRAVHGAVGALRGVTARQGVVGAGCEGRREREIQAMRASTHSPCQWPTGPGSADQRHLFPPCLGREFCFLCRWGAESSNYLQPKCT